MLAKLAALSVMTGLSALARAEVRLAAVFTDHMVVQRGRPLTVWGTAEPDEQGRVSFRGAAAGFRADALGRWRVSLPAGDAGGPFQLSVMGGKRTDLSDILVGDVWLASGQSNMEFTMSNRLLNGPAEIAKANLPEVRLLVVKPAYADHPLADIQTAGWKVCSPESAAAFSAVAYFFGRELNQQEHVPIGLIDATWGGTPAEAWTSLDALTSDAALMPVMASYAALTDSVAATQARQAIQRQTNAALKAAGKAPIDYPYEPSLNIWTPGALFNGMIAPLTPMPLRGVIWYQGESNAGAGRAVMYQRLFPALIADWRRQWGDDGMPFLFVQLANYNAAGDLATIREAQRQALALRGTGMAVTIDIGEKDNVHPQDKQDVGHRLALIARHQVYGEAVEDAGPMVSTIEVADGTATVHFTHDEGLNARGGAPARFEVCGEDGIFVAAEAKLDGLTVKVANPHVAHPVSVRYAWANDPAGNLYNGAGLPASPFVARVPGTASRR